MTEKARSKDDVASSDDDTDPVGDAKNKIAAQAGRRRTRSSYRAKAQLEQDKEDLILSLNTERFLFIITIVTIFDAFVFSKYENWSQAICLTVIEAGGLFVLARYLEVDEFVSFLVDSIRHFGKQRDKDESPKDDPSPDEPKSTA